MRLVVSLPSQLSLRLPLDSFEVSLAVQFPLQFFFFSGVFMMNPSWSVKAVTLLKSCYRDAKELDLEQISGTSPRSQRRQSCKRKNAVVVKLDFSKQLKFKILIN